MKRIPLLFAGLLCAGVNVHAKDDTAIRAFVATYDRAYQTGDTQAVETLLAADYRGVVEGAVKDRAAALAEFAAMDHAAITAMSTRLERIHVAGDLAVAVGRIHWTKGDETGGEYLTLVLRREAGQWKAVDEHVSDFAEDTAR